MSMDYPRAWQVARATLPGSHDQRCSYRQTTGGILCDCHIITKHAEYLDDELHTVDGHTLKREPLKVVAFLQNQWVRDAERVKESLRRRGDDYRRRFIRYALFAGCVTGQRIKAQLGSLIDSIVWDECSREIHDNPRTIPKADFEHIRMTLAAEDPALVVTFGRIASDAVGRVCNVEIIRSPHPAYRCARDKIAFESAMQTLRERLAADS